MKIYLLHGYDKKRFPVVQEQCNRILDASMEEEYYITQQGETERQPKGFSFTGYDNIEIYATTQEVVDTVGRLVEGAENRFEPQWVIQKIISEEAEGYFSGQVDLDSTVKKIQNRASLLLQEVQ